MERVLFTNTPSRQCGVHEFGRATWTAIRQSKKYDYIYEEFAEQTTIAEFVARVERWKPVAIVHNWHPATMPWFNDEPLYELHRRMPDIRHAAVMHDEFAPFGWMDGIIINDPTYRPNPGEFVVGRRLWDRPIPTTDPGPVIGTFGFATPGKGFRRVVEQVNAEFETATIRLHIPHSDYCDPHGETARALVAECVAVAKPGITIDASHHYLDVEGLLDWLAGNAINCFFYEPLPGRGISSVIDFALSVKRPIAISDSKMFRHILEIEPSIVIGRTSLKQILANGITPLKPLYARWTTERLAQDYDRLVDAIRTTPEVDLSSNRVLTVRDRERLRVANEELRQLSPDIMSRKFPQAVFQNGFIYAQAKKYLKPGDQVILVGGYEDPIGPALRRLGHDVVITDPNIDGKDSDQVLYDSLRTGQRYDLVISCSVIEHVDHDVEFVQTLFELLKPGGIALLTTDFRHGWQPGMPKPGPDIRLYTLERLRLLAESLPTGCLLDPPKWEAVPPYFHYDGTDYGFCSLAFRKPMDCNTSFANHLLIHMVESERLKQEKLKQDLEAIRKALEKEQQLHLQLHHEYHRLAEAANMVRQDRDEARMILGQFSGVGPTTAKAVRGMKKVIGYIPGLPWVLRTIAGWFRSKPRIS